MLVMSVIQILLGQWLLLACRLSGEVRVATCVWLPRGNREDLKKAVGSLSLPPRGSQALPRSRLSCSCSQQPIPNCPPDFVATGREFAEGLSPYPSLDFICLL